MWVDVDGGVGVGLGSAHDPARPIEVRTIFLRLGGTYLQRPRDMPSKRSSPPDVVFRMSTRSMVSVTLRHMSHTSS